MAAARRPPVTPPGDEVGSPSGMGPVVEAAFEASFRRNRKALERLAKL